MSILRARVQGIASAQPPEGSASSARSNLIIASACEAVLTLVGMTEEQRDLGMLDGVLEVPPLLRRDRPGPAALVRDRPRRQALQSRPETRAANLSPGEKALLDELLIRLAEHPD